MPTIQQLDDVGQPDVADETLYERFEATLTEIAQDLVPASQKERVSSMIKSMGQAKSNAWWASCRGAWLLATTLIVVVVPAVPAFIHESIAIEQEQQQRREQFETDTLSSGPSSLPAPTPV
eukprot:m.138044 g.138044  ORF g.138044 m.138044 type:complete len:121 (+) comp13992_c1_seq2:9007-9369(+)